MCFLYLNLTHVRLFISALLRVCQTKLLACKETAVTKKYKQCHSIQFFHLKTFFPFIHCKDCMYLLCCPYGTDAENTQSDFSPAANRFAVISSLKCFLDKVPFLSFVYLQQHTCN